MLRPDSWSLGIAHVRTFTCGHGGLGLTGLDVNAAAAVRINEGTHEQLHGRRRRMSQYFPNADAEAKWATQAQHSERSLYDEAKSMLRVQADQLHVNYSEWLSQ